MNEEKLPKELPLVASKYWDAFDLRKLQRDADQLLYDVLWAENEGLKAELAKVRQEMVGFITRYCDSRMTQHTGYSGQEELARLKTVITSRLSLGV